MNNQMELSFLSLAENEAFARMVISAFLMQLNPTMSLVSEVRTAVSEAVTNAVVHAYAGRTDGRILLRASLDEQKVEIEVEDFGCHCRRGAGHDAVLHLAAGSGAYRHGLFADALFHGRRACDLCAGKRHAGEDDKAAA